MNITEAGKLKAVMDKENLNWRSFVAQRAVSLMWDEPGTPTFYAIDGKGVIRYKWFGSPGEKALDRALDKLIGEAESDAKKTSL